MPVPAPARAAVLAGLVLAAGVLTPAAALVPGAARAGEVSFGPDLSKVTPSRDTANGAFGHTGSPAGTEHAISPDPHAAEDTALWNVKLPGGHAVASRGGQVTSLRIEGCAIKDATAPSQLSQGIAVNTVIFQTLAPSHGNWTVTYDDNGGFTVPFCSSSGDPAHGAVSTSTVTTYHPLHECLAPGQAVTFHDIGGFVPAVGGRGPWYPQGVPFDVIAPVAGAQLQSYVGLSATYGPGAPGGNGAGFAVQPGEELTMQVTEGTGPDAYGVCPGGKANEPLHSNRIVCVYGLTHADHPECDAKGRPIPGTGRRK